ncbi:MAG: DJ-1/PfpI family protein [Epsilonproteobacteria bacterium]|nr:DJ-1/PfpI family protein [Campylobacterota bacterium]
MARVCIPLAEGFEDIEAITLIDVIRRGGIEVVTAGVGADIITSAHNVKVIADTTIDKVSADDFDLVVLPGGLPGATNLAKSQEVKKLLQDMDKKGKYVGAICAAPIALKEAGVLKDKYTAYPGWQDNIKEEGYVSDAKVVEDQNVLTSKGPATAMCFGLEIVRKFASQEMYEQLKAGLLADFC